MVLSKVQRMSDIISLLLWTLLAVNRNVTHCEVRETLRDGKHHKIQYLGTANLMKEWVVFLVTLCLQNKLFYTQCLLFFLFNSMATLSNLKKLFNLLCINAAIVVLE